MAAAASLLVKVLMDTQSIASGVAEANSKLGKFGKTVTQIGGVVATAVSGQQLVGFLEDSMIAARDEAKEMALLDQALRNNMKATDDQVKSVEKWITKTQNATGVADGELRPAFAKLAIAGRSVEQVQSDLAVALDIAAARGLDLETVVQAMSKAAQGNEGALSKLGIQTKDASDKTMAYDDILKNASKTMGGSAARAADTAAGRAAILGAKFNDLKESIGERLIPAFDNIVKRVNKVIDWFQELNKPTQNLILAIGGVFAAVVVLTPAVAALAVAVNAVTWPVLLVVAIIALLVAAFVLAYKKSQTFRNIVDNVAKWFTETLVPSIKEGIAWLKEKLAPVFRQVAKNILEKWQEFKAWWDENWPRIKTIVEANIAAIKLIVQGALQGIRTFWRLFGDDIVNVTRGSWQIISNIIGGFVTVIGGIISVFLAVLSGDWRGAFNAIINTSRSWANSITGILGGVLNVIRGLFGGAFDYMRWVAANAFDYLLALPGRLAGLGAGLASMLGSAARQGINAMLGVLEGGLNAAIRGANRILGLVPGVPTLPSVNLPRLAKGGIVNGPTLALIGEAGPEAVVPLSGANAPRMGGSYQITVNVAPGTSPVDVGRALVDSIKAFERSNGAGWRGAA